MDDYSAILYAGLGQNGHRRARVTGWILVGSVYPSAYEMAVTMLVIHRAGVGSCIRIRLSTSPGCGIVGGATVVDAAIDFMFCSSVQGIQTPRCVESPIVTLGQPRRSARHKSWCVMRCDICSPGTKPKQRAVAFVFHKSRTVYSKGRGIYILARRLPGGRIRYTVPSISTLSVIQHIINCQVIPAHPSPSLLTR